VQVALSEIEGRMVAMLAYFFMLLVSPFSRFCGYVKDNQDDDEGAGEMSPNLNVEKTVAKLLFPGGSRDH
jgi:hypothetical protein